MMGSYKPLHLSKEINCGHGNAFRTKRLSLAGCANQVTEPLAK